MINTGTEDEGLYPHLKRNLTLTTLHICIHWVCLFVSSFRVPQMLVWTNQHLDSVLMCHWEDPQKITTFDKTPWVSHCPQLSPLQQGKDNPIHLPPREIKATAPSFSFYYQRLHLCKVPSQMRLCINHFLCGVKGSVFERTENKQGH